MFGKMVGIPTYLLAFNAYYEQKKAALREPAEMLAAFLDADSEARVRDQDRFVAELREVRSNWQFRVETVLAAEPGSTTTRSRAELRLARAESDVEAAGAQAAKERALREQLQATLSELGAREAVKLARIADLDGALATAKLALGEGETAREVLKSRLAEVSRAHDDVAREVERLQAAAAKPHPLRHQLVDAVNDRLKKTGGDRIHGAIKRVLGHS